MLIDGRGIEIKDVLLRVRDALRSPEASEGFEVVVGQREEAARVKAFCAMTGCTSVQELEGDAYHVRIKAGNCGCG